MLKINKQVEPCCWMTYTVHRDTQVYFSLALFILRVIEGIVFVLHYVYIAQFP